MRDKSPQVIGKVDKGIIAALELKRTLISVRIYLL